MRPTNWFIQHQCSFCLGTLHYNQAWAWHDLRRTHWFICISAAFYICICIAWSRTGEDSIGLDWIRLHISYFILHIAYLHCWRQAEGKGRQVDLCVVLCASWGWDGRWLWLWYDMIWYTIYRSDTDADTDIADTWGYIYITYRYAYYEQNGGYESSTYHSYIADVLLDIKNNLRPYYSFTTICIHA